MPDGILNINKYAFMQTNTPIINIPSSIKQIDNFSFTQCPNIKTININKAEDSIDGAPWGASNATINWTGDN